MIREIEVSNYQSLHDLNISLGRFTVITGRTGAGKSGLVRALKALVFNARGTSYITRGEKQCSVSMSGDEDSGGNSLWRAVIQRGSKDQYQLETVLPPEQDAEGDFSQVKVFTKLAGKVPEAVSDTLRLGDINFASQFDKPYLLDSTGGDVARVLGKLTNVIVLFRAAQEANRRRLQVSGELKTRQADLASLAEQIQQYATLPAELTVVENAEEGMIHLHLLCWKQERLDFLTTSVARALATKGSLKSVPEPPSLDLLEELMLYRQRLEIVIGRQQGAVEDLHFAKQQEQGACAGEAARQQELERYVSQWGVCEACGQPVQKDYAHQEGK
jgi:DNA repair ATPase RecN